MLSQAGSIIAGSFVRAPWGWGLFGLSVIAFIKIMPLLSAQAIDAMAQRRKEKREDLGDCQRRLDEMAARMDSVEEKFRLSELKLLGAISAYRILDAEVEATNPGATALAQARLVMSAAFTLSPSTEGAKQ